jgi:hypothetical protein
MRETASGPLLAKPEPKVRNDMATATGLSDELARVLIYEYHDTHGTATFPQLFDRILYAVPQ